MLESLFTSPLLAVHRQVAATDKVKPSVRIFLFFSILSHILYISPHTEILAQLSHLKTPTFCSSHSHPILCAAVFNFCHHHRYLNCERFTVVPVQMHSPPLPVTFARHTLCCGETGVLCLTPGQSSSSLIISSNLLRVCAPARLVLIFSGSEVTWNVMIVHNTAVARRRVLFLVNRARFTTVSGQGQALAPPPPCIVYLCFLSLLYYFECVQVVPALSLGSLQALGQLPPPSPDPPVLYLPLFSSRVM